MLNGKVMIIHLIVGLMLLKMSYFLPYIHSKNTIEVE